MKLLIYKTGVQIIFSLSFPQVQKSKKPAFFIKLSKSHDSFELLKGTSQREKQVYLCLLWLSHGGHRPLTRKLRWKAQRLLGISWRQYHRWIKRLKACQLLIDHKRALTGQWEKLANNHFSEGQFFKVPVYDKDGLSIFSKGFDIESWINQHWKADLHPTGDQDQKDWIENLAVAERTARYRRSRTKALKAKRQEMTLNNLILLSKNKKTTENFDSKAGYSGFLALKAIGTDPPRPVPWFLTKKLKFDRGSRLAFCGVLHTKSVEKYHYRPEIQGRQEMTLSKNPHRQRLSGGRQKVTYLTPRESRIFGLEGPKGILQSLREEWDRWKHIPERRAQIERDGIAYRRELDRLKAGRH